MTKLICLFFPALTCVWLFEHLSKKDLKRKPYICLYALDTILINGIVFGVKQYFLKTASYPLSDASGDMPPSAAFNFLIISMFAVVCVAVAQVFLSKNAKLSVEENRDAH